MTTRTGRIVLPNLYHHAQLFQFPHQTICFHWMTTGSLRRRQRKPPMVLDNVPHSYHEKISSTGSCHLGYIPFAQNMRIQKRMVKIQIRIRICIRIHPKIPIPFDRSPQKGRKLWHISEMRISEDKGVEDSDTQR